MEGKCLLQPHGHSVYGAGTAARRNIIQKCLEVNESFSYKNSSFHWDINSGTVCVWRTYGRFPTETTAMLTIVCRVQWAKLQCGSAVFSVSKQGECMDIADFIPKATQSGLPSTQEKRHKSQNNKTKPNKIIKAPIIKTETTKMQLKFIRSNGLQNNFCYYF